MTLNLLKDRRSRVDSIVSIEIVSGIGTALEPVSGNAHWFDRANEPRERFFQWCAFSEISSLDQLLFFG
jgi:hypothetical protein